MMTSTASAATNVAPAGAASSLGPWLVPRAAVRILAWLARDTFRQAFESRVAWLMLGLSVVAIATCASVSVVGDTTIHRVDDRPDFLPRGDRDTVARTLKRDGVDVPTGDLTLAFGAFQLPLARDRADAVRFIQVVLAALAAGVAGLFLTLIWTAGFLPEFVAPRTAALVVSKPVPRSFLFLGKSAGVLLFVAAQTTVLVVGTWVALGARTGVWDASYLWSLPLLVVQFAVFFSVSALIAAHRRATSACVLGALLFWVLCWGVNYGRHAVVALPRLAPSAAHASPFLGTTIELGYWILPKPADFNMVLSDVVGAGDHFATVPEFEAVRQLHRFHPVAAMLSSLATGALILTVAVRRFERLDY